MNKGFLLNLKANRLYRIERNISVNEHLLHQDPIH